MRAMAAVSTSDGGNSESGDAGALRRVSANVTESSAARVKSGNDIEHSSGSPAGGGATRSRWRAARLMPTRRTRQGGDRNGSPRGLDRERS